LNFRYIVVFVAVFIAGCANQYTLNQAVDASKPSLKVEKEKQWLKMTGKWYGIQPTKEGGVSQHIVERTRDGLYKITFRKRDVEGKWDEFTEVGQWGMSASVYFTIFRGWIDQGGFTPSDSDDPYNYDAYELIKLSESEFEYQHIGTKNKFKICTRSN